MHQEHKINIQNLKPGLVASYNLQPQNGVGLFLKKKTSDGVNKQEKISKKTR